MLLSFDLHTLYQYVFYTMYYALCDKGGPERWLQVVNNRPTCLLAWELTKWLDHSINLNSRD